jgi:MFS transporter, DHA1 family, staphyloferrin A biosynthesis exporter
MSRLTRLSTFESLTLRDFRFLWLGQVTTSMGQWMDQFSRTWLIFQLTRSPMALGIVSAARGVPLLIFGIAAGVAADRYGRKAQLIIAQITNAVLNVILATLILTGKVQVWHVYVTALLAGTVQAFQQPARQALINDLVGGERLLNAVSLNSAALNLSRSIGPAVCGVIIAASGVDVSYYVQAFLYAAATLWTFQIRVPKHADQPSRPANEPQQSFLASAKEGFAYIGSHRLILALMVLGLAPILLGMPYQSLMPIFAVDVLHGGPTTQGLLVGAMGAGAVVGGLVIASLGRRQGNGKLLIAGAAGFGLSLILFSRSPVVWMAACFTFLVGLSNSAYTSQDQTIIQTVTEPRLRGRVLGVYLLNRGLMPVGSILAGALATWFGGPWAVSLMGFSCLILAICVPIFYRPLWNSRLIDGRTGAAATRS